MLNLQKGKWTERYAACWSSAYSLGPKLTVFRILKGQVSPPVTTNEKRTNSEGFGRHRTLCDASMFYRAFKLQRAACMMHLHSVDIQLDALPPEHNICFSTFSTTGMQSSFKSSGVSIIYYRKEHDNLTVTLERTRIRNNDHRP
jgi:hypothetical protein